MKTSCNNLKEKLALQYDIVFYDDIANLIVSHKKIFETFKQIKKPAYEPTEKIILYSSQYLDQIVLDHITRAAAKIDVSNFFILICNPYNISEKLLESNKKYGYDNSCIQSMIINLENTNQIYTDVLYSFDSMCPAPFSQVSVRTDGRISPCCKFNKNLKTSDDESLLSVFYNKNFSEVREKMKKGMKLPECRECWQTENSGTVSLRKHYLDKLEGKMDYSWLDDIKIRDLTISPSNICNFKCRICHYKQSSSMATERINNSNSKKEIGEIKKYLKDVSINNNKSYIFDSVASIGDSLEYLHILGGEPLMHPQLQKIIDMVINKSCANNISLEFNTNGSIFPNNLIEKFKKFKFVEILLSIDDIGKRFEIQRGGDWDAIKQNLTKFSKIRTNNIKVRPVVTVNIQNLMYLDEIYVFFKNYDMDILWMYLDRPWYYCIDYINQETQNAVIKKYAQHEVKELQNIAQRVMSNEPIDNVEFLKACSNYDTIRNQNFKNTHTEIFKLMSSNLDDNIN